MWLTPLYHWSPAERRGSIDRRGLAPKQEPTIELGDPDDPLIRWRAPYVCFATTPALAWALSGSIVAAAGQTWDLWQVQLGPADHVEVRPDWGPRVIEVRVHNRIPCSRVWWVADRLVTREHFGRSRPGRQHRRPPWW